MMGDLSDDAAWFATQISKGKAELDVWETPLGTKVGLKSPTGPDYMFTPEERESMQEILNEYEDVLVAIYEADEAHDDPKRRWHIGEAIAENTPPSVEPDYGILADLTSFLDLDEEQLRQAVCLAEMFDENDDVPTIVNTEAVERAGKRCVSGADEVEVRKALTSTPSE